MRDPQGTRMTQRGEVGFADMSLPRRAAASAPSRNAAGTRVVRGPYRKRPKRCVVCGWLDRKCAAADPVAHIAHTARSNFRVGLDRLVGSHAADSRSVLGHPCISSRFGRRIPFHVVALVRQAFPLVRRTAVRTCRVVRPPSKAHQGRSVNRSANSLLGICGICHRVSVLLALVTPGRRCRGRVSRERGACLRHPPDGARPDPSFS